MAITKKSIFNQQYNDVSDFGKALAHPARVMILEILVAENRCVSDLTERIPLAQSTISQHLKELKKHGLIDTEIVGKQNFYCINQSRYTELQSALTQMLKKVMIQTP
ncbi:ArsR/SmtB family transcription factor [Shewanella surugensis]|uniref:Metalloregulator ArsR/SmtB family transcription factor n=1 Tax=Shewanella surugensis TaxID=212020 RepID=A0ABT0LBX8_9GAMM|nr:metalloregulator ArsR/SmtB family transcription factor [Shewanella surugensis]MCL1125207.1 metalloregulator ArsR/SmtB family transcription factor [Shewanella surugensis]